MYTCPVVDHGEMEVVHSFVGTHLTGDSKDYGVRCCSQCLVYHFCVSMDASLGSGSNYFAFRIELTEKEASEVLAILADQSDANRVEQHLKSFDENN